MEGKHLIRFRLTDKEYETFKAQVKQSGLSQNTFLRKLIRGCKLSQRPCEHHAELLNKMSDLSNAAQWALRRMSESDVIEQAPSRICPVLAPVRRIRAMVVNIIDKRNNLLPVGHVFCHAGGYDLAHLCL